MATVAHHLGIEQFTDQTHEGQCFQLSGAGEMVMDLAGGNSRFACNAPHRHGAEPFV
ncbi:hypothetical protein D3C85_1832020 [compost metagenome]